MPSKSRLIYLVYKNEFLRRNKDYLKDHRKAVRDIRKYIRLKHSQGGVLTDEDNENLINILNRVRKKWGGLHDPRIDDIDIDRLDDPAVMSELAGMLAKSMPWGYKPPIQPLNVHFAADRFCFLGEDLNKGKVTLEVNLTYSKKRLIEEFESVLTAMKSSYELVAPQGKTKKSENTHKKKYHFENFDLYLRVWDMKEKENMSWSKITSALKLNSQQTARNHYNAADRLIKEGIGIR